MIVKKTGPKTIKIGKELLYQKYYKENLTKKEVAEFFGISRDTVYLRCRDYGFPNKFNFKKINNIFKNGKDNRNWKGGKFLDKRTGYIKIGVPGRTRKETRYMPEHRFIMEQYLGRSLTKNEAVHHINGIRVDNRIENLHLYSTGDHAKTHKQLLLECSKLHEENNGLKILLIAALSMRRIL